MAQSNFNKAIEEQLRVLYEAPRPKKKKRSTYTEPVVSTNIPARRTPSNTTGTGDGSGA